MAWPTPNSIPAALTGRVLLIPNDIQIIQSVMGALLELTFPYNWQQIGTVTPDQIASEMQDVIWAALDWFPALVGTVFPIVTALPPDGSVLCDGSIYLRTQYPLLYAAMAPIFQIDADHFYVPDLRGRTIIAAGNGSGLSPRAVGDTVGEENHQLTIAELASHTHSTGNSFLTATATPPPLDVLGPNPFPASTGSSGNDVPHNTMQPSFALNYAVWVV